MLSLASMVLTYLYVFWTCVFVFVVVRAHSRPKMYDSRWEISDRDSASKAFKTSPMLTTHRTRG